ncbi:alpha/beta fold hydrolase [Patescibacteria group bacterium]
MEGEHKKEYNFHAKMNVHYIRTSDDLRLLCVEYSSKNKELCVLFIHGMSGNFIENYFASVLGLWLSRSNLGFIYGHNRGYNHINDIATSEVEKEGGYKTKRIGAMYEIFDECILDIDACLNKCIQLGYKKIILMGHSLGCNKVIYYLSKKKPSNVVGVVLTSPPDMVGLAKKPEYLPNYSELYEEAKKNVDDGKPRRLLTSMIWDWYKLSSQTFLNLFTDGGLVDNLPVLRNPTKWKQLASVNVPILGIMGEYDDIAINDLKEDLDLIESKATSCPSFTKKHIKKANHNYDSEEGDLAKVVLSWVKNEFEK